MITFHQRSALYAIIAGLLYWPVEALIHTYAFQDGSLLQNILYPGANEIWMRCLISSSFIVLGIHMNIASRQLQQVIQKLKHQEARSRRIIETAHDAYINIDEASHIKAWNPQAEALFGWNKNEVIGKTLTETIIPKQLRAAHLRGMKHYLHSASGPWLYKTIKTEALTKQGQHIRVEMTIIPLADRDTQEFYAFIHPCT